MPFSSVELRHPCSSVCNIPHTEISVYGYNLLRTCGVDRYGPAVAVGILEKSDNKGKLI